MSHLIIPMINFDLTKLKIPSNRYLCFLQKNLVFSKAGRINIAGKSLITYDIHKSTPVIVKEGESAQFIIPKINFDITG